MLPRRSDADTVLHHNFVNQNQHALLSPRATDRYRQDQTVPMSPLARGAPLSAPPAGTHSLRGAPITRTEELDSEGQVQPFQLAPTPAQLGRAPLQRRLSMGELNYLNMVMISF